MMGAWCCGACPTYPTYPPRRAFPAAPPVLPITHDRGDRLELGSPRTCLCGCKTNCGLVAIHWHNGCSGVVFWKISAAASTNTCDLRPRQNISHVTTDKFSPYEEINNSKREDFWGLAGYNFKPTLTNMWAWLGGKASSTIIRI